MVNGRAKWLATFSLLISILFVSKLGFPEPSRNTCLLQEIFDQGILEGKPLAPGFAAPEPEGMDHHLYSMHIEKSLPEETPGMFGMPPNAETGYLTNAADEIFSAFLRWVYYRRCTVQKVIFHFHTMPNPNGVLSFPERLETVGAGKNANAQEDDDSSVVTTNGSTAAGFATADSIRQNLLPSLPSSFDVNAIESQASVNCASYSIFSRYR